MIMADDVGYKGWKIEPQSLKSDGARWRPKAVVSIHEGAAIHQHHVAAPLGVMYATERDADAYAVEMAKKWIDERG